MCGGRGGPLSQAAQRGREGARRGMRRGTPRLETQGPQGRGGSLPGGPPAANLAAQRFTSVLLAFYFLSVELLKLATLVKE